MTTSLELTTYEELNQKFWPQKPGNYIIAQQRRVKPQSRATTSALDEIDTVVVYQAYKESIASFASAHQTFAGCPDFSPTRMTWIKTNFMWMMFRSGWATKKDQERILAIDVRTEVFKDMVARSVKSSYREEEDESKSDTQNHENKQEWQEALKRSNIRLQFDPDHNPFGQKKGNGVRLLQLGLRGSESANYVSNAIVRIEDVTEFVHEQYEQHVRVIEEELEKRKKNNKNSNESENSEVDDDDDDFQKKLKEMNRNLKVPKETIFETDDEKILMRLK